MALSDFWELKDHQVVGGQNILNVYHCKRILAGAVAADVANAFTFSILAGNFRGMQTLALTRTTIEVQNLGFPTDFTSIDSSAFGGTDTNQYQPSFYTTAIQLNRTRTDMKNGQKRYFMGSELDVSNGVWDTNFLNQMDLVGNTLIDPWVTLLDPLVDVCNMAILKRFCVVPAQDPCLKYRLPNTDAEIDAFHYVPLAFLSRTRPRTQNSRKVL